jgi:hypothetical protein
MDSLVAQYNAQYAAIMSGGGNINRKRKLIIQLNNRILPKVRAIKAQSAPSNAKYALVMGTNYPNTPYQLYGCENDVHSLEALFKGKGYAVTTLCDDGPRPTKTNILNAFADVLKKAKNGDTVAVTFSCHGNYERGLLEEEQVLISSDLKNISDVELKNVLRLNLKKGVSVFVMFDSCHSGSTMNLRYSYLQTDGTPDVDLTKDETVSQVVSLSGCTDKQTSADASFGGIPNGALTKAFLTVVAKAVTYRGLVQGVREFMKNNRFSQTPQLEAGAILDIDKPFVL